MIPIHCHTNLDISCERWPTELPQVPSIGDLIQSETVYPSGFQLRLKVVRITWKKLKDCYEWHADVELHNHLSQSITEFHDWYNDLKRRYEK